MTALREIFYGPEALGIASPAVLAKLAGVTVEEAKHFIQHQDIHQRFSVLDKKSLFVPITAEPWVWQIDLMFYGSQLTPILCCIDITSRLLRTAVLRNKSAQVVADAFARILDEGARVDGVESDDGAEFKGAFAKLLDARKIHHLVYPSTQASDTAMAKVERVNGTLRTWLNKMPNAQRDLHSLVPELTDFYNCKVHSITGLSPDDFVSKYDENYKLQDKHEKAFGAEPSQRINEQYQVGTRVRLAKTHGTFGKRSQAKWTKEIHTITGREGYNFTVDGKDKPYRAWEMLPVLEPVGDREQTPVVVEPRAPLKVEPLVKGRVPRARKVKVNKDYV